MMKIILFLIVTIHFLSSCRTNIRQNYLENETSFNKEKLNNKKELLVDSLKQKSITKIVCYSDLPLIKCTRTLKPIYYIIWEEDSIIHFTNIIKNKTFDGGVSLSFLEDDFHEISNANTLEGSNYYLDREIKIEFNINDLYYNYTLVDFDLIKNRNNKKLQTYFILKQLIESFENK